MPIGGFSYSLPSGLSRTPNNRGMVLKQGATSDSPAVQSLMGPQTQWNSFLPKRSDKNTLSPKIPSPAPTLNSNYDFVSNYKNANNADIKPYSPNQQTQLKPDLPKAEQRDAKSDSLAQSGSRLPMTSNELRKKARKLPGVPKDVTKYFNELMAEKANAKKGSALPLQQQLPVSLRDSNNAAAFPYNK